MRSVVRLALLSFAIALPTSGFAGPIIDFSTLSTFPPGNATAVSPGFDHGGIFVDGGYFDTTVNTWIESTLIARNVPGDHGLGVCSPGEDSGQNSCNIGAGGGGDFNELSQLVNQEGILLSKPADWQWTGIWLSSLDGNDGNGAQGLENGVVYWGNNFDPFAANPLTDGGSFAFTFPAFGPGVVEGSLPFPPVGFDPTATYLWFVPGGGIGDNNDYLVWGVDVRTPRDGEDVPVPEPASLLLVGSGLVGLVRSRRRSRR